MLALMNFLKANHPDTYDIVEKIPFVVEKFSCSGDRKSGANSSYSSRGSFVNYSLDLKDVSVECQVVTEMICWYKVEKSLLMSKVFSGEVTNEQYATELTALIVKSSRLINGYVGRVLKKNTVEGVCSNG